MANSSPPPPAKAEFGSSPPQPRRKEPNPIVKQEQQQQRKQLAITPNAPTETHQQQKQPHFISYVDDLRSLSPALSAFHRRYDELHEHLDFVRTSIDSKLLQLLDTEVGVPTADESGKSDIQSSDEIYNQLSSQLQLGTELGQVVDELGKSEQQTKGTNNNGQQSLSEIESICKIMDFRSLRRYIMSNLSNLPKLREEIPVALKLASNPAKLVLDCFGRFFLQGIKAYYKDSPMIPSRKASVLVLEYFLIMGFDSDGIDAALKQEAESSALEWRKRLITEGGLVKACEIDARGLLLLIGCFGIPKMFKHEDIWDLIRAGNAIEISDTLRRSNDLLRRIPDAIEWMMKNKMEVEAVDITYTFGLEKKFPPGKILLSFLDESKQTWKTAKIASEGSVAYVNKANKRQLADLKSVRKCLEDHKMDPSKVLPGRKLNNIISKLEMKISDLNKKLNEQVRMKRKEADEIEPSNMGRSQDIKRARYAIADSRPHVDFVERKTMDGGIPQFTTAYSAYSPRAGPSTGIRAGDVLSPGSYATAFRGGILVDRVGQINTHASVHPYELRGEASLNDRLVSHSYGEPSALGVSSLYRAPAAVEGFSGLLDPSSIGVSYRNSTSDLYQFADTILERETYGGSRTGASATVPPPRLASAHHTAYYY